jgi:hypothetical protein
MPLSNLPEKPNKKDVVNQVILQTIREALVSLTEEEKKEMFESFQTNPPKQNDHFLDIFYRVKYFVDLLENQTETTKDGMVHIMDHQEIPRPKTPSVK